MIVVVFATSGIPPFYSSGMHLMCCIKAYSSSDDASLVFVFNHDFLHLQKLLTEGIAIQTFVFDSLFFLYDVR